MPERMASQIFRELTDGKYIEFYGDEGQSLELCLEEGTVLAENLEILLKTVSWIRGIYGEI